MTRVFKILLCWLMMAVFPVQGYAAVSQAACAGNGTAPVVHEPENPCAPAGQDSPALHGDDVSHHTGSPTAAGAVHAMAPMAGGHEHQPSGCSVCVLCHMSTVALTATLLPTSVLSMAEIFFSSTSHLGSGITLSGPDRPPRRLSL